MTLTPELRAKLDEALDLTRLINKRQHPTEGPPYDWQPLLTLVPRLTKDEIDTLEVAVRPPRPGFSPHILGVVAAFGPSSVTRAVLAAGADPNRGGADGGDYFPVVLAGGNPDVGVLAALLEAGADAGIADRVGFTSLHDAARLSAATHVELLLRAGADPLKPSQIGQTPMDLARERSPRDPEIERLLRAASMERLRGTKGAAIKLRGTGKSGGLRKFAARRHDAGLRFLLLAATAPASVLADEVAAALVASRVVHDGLARRVFGVRGVFVLQRRGSPWSIAYLSLGEKRPDRTLALKLAERLRVRLGDASRLAVVASGSVLTWADGTLSARILAESPGELSELGERFVAPAGGEVREPVLDWDSFFRTLGLEIPDVFDASNGVELVLSVEGRKTDFEALSVVVLEE